MADLPELEGVWFAKILAESGELSGDRSQCFSLRGNRLRLGAGPDSFGNGGPEFR